MKASSATYDFSKAASAGLRYLVEEDHPQLYLTTSWFLEQVNHWFDLVSSYHVNTALSKLKGYQLPIGHDLSFSWPADHQRSCKPIQTRVVMATSTILEIQQDMLSHLHRFVVTSRFTQNCLQNTYSFV